MADSDYHVGKPEATSSSFGVNSEIGYKAWETRRANAFLKAVRLLHFRARTEKFEALVAAGRTISNYLIRFIPEETPQLPRGFGVSLTHFQERSLSYNGVLLDPSFIEDLPTREVLERIGAEISAWLDELIAFLGPKNRFFLFWSKWRGMLG